MQVATDLFARVADFSSKMFKVLKHFQIDIHHTIIILNTFLKTILLGKSLKSTYAISSSKHAFFSLFWWKYLTCPVSLSFYVLSLLLVNGTQVLHVNPVCLKCFSGKNVSPATKNVFTFSFILYLQNKIQPDSRVLL